MIAYSHRESYEFLLAFGITSAIVWGAIFNIAVVTGLLPSTGITLPFISYGGSSLLSNSIMAGILLNLSRGGVPSSTQADMEAV
jgi:cell division protein FtsW